MKTTDKTTQELREAIEKILSYHGFDVFMEKEGIDKLLSLIAKHEAELVEKMRTDVIGEDEMPLSSTDLEKIYQENGGNVGRVEIFEGNMEEVILINKRLAEQRAKLTALTEKESKE